MLDLQTNVEKLAEYPVDVIIDGNNVAYDNVPKGKAPHYENLELALKHFAEKDLNVRIIVDASLRHEIDDKKVFNEALNKKLITQSPAGVQADEYILKLALAHPKSRIVSNDNYENWRKRKGKEFDEIKKEVLDKKKRLIKFKINGEFIEFNND